MQILYVVTMIAIFVLCIALFSTARRILHSTSRPGGELSLVHLKSAIEPYESDVELKPVDMADLPPQAEDFEPPPIAEEPTLAAVAAPPAEMQEAVPTEEATPSEAPQDIASVATEDHHEIRRPNRPSRRSRIAAHLPGGYNYFLECLLLGVSIVVLVQTQRSTSRYRSELSSDQVA